MRSELLERSQALWRPSRGSARDVAGGLLIGTTKARSTIAVSAARWSRRARRAALRIEQTASLRVECDARRVLGVRTDVGFVAAGAVVNACGAWAARLPRRAAIVRSADRAGERADAGAGGAAGFRAAHNVVAGAYLVPRDDGRLLVGATVEAAGFDERVTARRHRALLHAALAAAPSLGAFTVTREWAGLRPGTPDGLPFLGPTPIAGLFLATGHYRNGILLAPATARAIADAVEGKPVARATALLARTASTRKNRLAETNHSRVKATINGALARAARRAHGRRAARDCSAHRAPGIAVARNERIVRARSTTATASSTATASRSSRRWRVAELQDDVFRIGALESALAADRRNRKVSVDGGHAGGARGQRRRDGDGRDPPHQSRRSQQAARCSTTSIATRYTILPNTAGCYTAKDAVLTAQLARELLGTDLDQARGHRRSADAASRYASRRSTPPNSSSTTALPCSRISATIRLRANNSRSSAAPR